MLKLLESPYSTTAEGMRLVSELPAESEQQDLDESAAATSTQSPDNYDSAAMSRYFGKPPDWALGLCVT